MALGLGAAHDQAFAEIGPTLQESVDKSLARPGEAPTVAVFGDSTGLALAVGLAIRDDAHADLRVVKGWATVGCSMTSPAVVHHEAKSYPTPPACATWRQEWASAAARVRPDVALVVFGPWEVHELKPQGVQEFRVIGDPVLDALLERNLVAGLETLLAASKVVAIATSPYIHKGRVTPPLPESDPARMDRLNALVRRVARRYDRVAVIDLAGFIAGRSDDVRLRPDGVHYTIDTARELADPLAVLLVALAGGTATPERTGPITVLQWPAARR